MTFLEFVVVLMCSPVVGALLYGTYQFNRESLADLGAASKATTASAPVGEAA